MRILLFGTSGQVGWELRRALQPIASITALSRGEADFDEPESLRGCFASSPDVILNAVAYTAVDQAESEADRAMRINAESVAVIADEAKRLGALVVHYSTDYVFDGTAPVAYREDDPTNPQSAYGRSKLAGESALSASGCDHLTLRTSWVYASRGKNFLRTILRLAAERERLRIVGDQYGAPTAARLIADCTAQIVVQAMRERHERRFASAVLHLAAAGRTSWHGFASHVVERARSAGRSAIVTTSVDPIAASEYPLPAKRPSNSMLDTTRLHERYGLHLPDWTSGVDLCLEELWAG